VKRSLRLAPRLLRPTRLPNACKKGDKALYRARFAGFDKQTAEKACKQLKRSNLECVALKN
jgi:D-alanyl-D-alanine carboxypeptidase